MSRETSHPEVALAAAIRDALTHATPEQSLERLLGGYIPAPHRRRYIRTIVALNQAIVALNGWRPGDPIASHPLAIVNGASAITHTQRTLAWAARRTHRGALTGRDVISARKASAVIYLNSVIAAVAKHANGPVELRGVGRRGCPVPTEDKPGLGAATRLPVVNPLAVPRTHHP